MCYCWGWCCWEDLHAHLLHQQQVPHCKSFQKNQTPPIKASSFIYQVPLIFLPIFLNFEGSFSVFGLAFLFFYFFKTRLLSEWCFLYKHMLYNMKLWTYSLKCYLGLLPLTLL